MSVVFGGANFTGWEGLAIPSSPGPRPFEETNIRRLEV